MTLTSLPPANEVRGKVMFSQVFVHGRGPLYDVTSCLVVWSHAPYRGSLSLVPCSFGESLSRGFLSRWISVQGGFLPGRSLRGLCPGGLCRETHGIIKAGGTHPTRMFSCNILILFPVFAGVADSAVGG